MWRSGSAPALHGEILTILPLRKVLGSIPNFSNAFVYIFAILEDTLKCYFNIEEGGRRRRVCTECSGRSKKKPAILYLEHVESSIRQAGAMANERLLTQEPSLWVLVTWEDPNVAPGFRTPEPGAGAGCEWPHLHLVRVNMPNSDNPLTKRLTHTQFARL